MEDNKAKIDRIVSEANDFRFGDYIGQGFDIFKKKAGEFIGFTVILIMLSVVISLIPFVGSIANALVVSPPLLAGLYLVARKVHRGEGTEFGDFFKGFDFTGQLALTALVMNLIVIATLIPFGIICWNSGLVEWYKDVLSNPTNPPTSLPDFPPLWSFLLLLPSIFLSIAYSWASMFVVFHKMDFWSALEASRKLLTKQWLIYFLFCIVLGFIMMAGVLLLCVGILASMPAAYCMLYAAFADLTKLNAEPEEGEGIEQHLVD